MHDKVTFICVVLVGCDGENFSWSKMYVNIEPLAIHDEVYDLVRRFPDMLDRTIHMKHYGFNDDEDEFLNTHYDIIAGALHE